MGGTSLNCAATVAGETSAVATSAFFKISGYLHSQTTETSCQITARSAGTLKNLYVRVSANSLSAVGTKNFRVRKGAADGNQVVDIGIVAGVYEDTTNTDTVSAGDKINYKFEVTAASGTATFMVLSTLFDATTDTVTYQVNGGSTTALSTASTTYYNPPMGRPQANTTEAQVKYRVRKAGTYKNLEVNIISNGRTTNTVWTTRKNGAAGNLTVTFGSGATGSTEDTTHTDSVSAGDDYNHSVALSTGTGTFNLKIQKLEFVSTAGDCLVLGSDTPTTITDNTTRFYSVGGTCGNTATEADSKVKMRYAPTASEMILLITANTINASSTVTSRKNGAAGNQTVTVTTTATGLFNDTTHTDTLTTTDDYNFQYAATSVSGTQTTTVSWIGCNFNLVTTTQ